MLEFLFFPFSYRRRWAKPTIVGQVEVIERFLDRFVRLGLLFKLLGQLSCPRMNSELVLSTNKEVYK